MPESLRDLRAGAHADRSDGAALGALGVALAERREGLRGLPFLRAAVRCRPGDARAHRDLANTLLTLNRPQEAADSYETALKLEPRFSELYQLLGDIYLDRLNAPRDAFRTFWRVVSLTPPDWKTYRNVARCWLRECTPGEVIRRMGELSPGANNPLEFLKGVASALADSGRYHEAARQFEEVLTHSPDDLVSLGALGRIWSALRDIRSANRCFERGSPVAGDDQTFLGAWLAHLSRMGDFEGARRLFHSRIRSPDLWWDADPAVPIWKGEDLRDKTFLLDTGSYFGDALQFVRFAGLLQEAGARVVVQCPKPLRSLLRTVPGVDLAIAPHDCRPRCDYQASAFWLLYGLREPIDATIGGSPYLEVPKALHDEWRCRIPQRPGPNVGIVWQGSHTYHGNAYACRSLPLEELRPLADIPGAALYSLQTGPGAAQAIGSTAPFPVIDIGLDFVNTAAAIQALDVVVTIDTSIAHLAGALGARTYVMLPYDACFRWMMDRDDSPWYRGVRLFRQAAPGDWSGVVASVVASLRSLHLCGASNSAA